MISCFVFIVIQQNVFKCCRRSSCFSVQYSLTHLRLCCLPLLYLPLSLCTPCVSWLFFFIIIIFFNVRNPKNWDLRLFFYGASTLFIDITRTIQRPLCFTITFFIWIYEIHIYCFWGFEILYLILTHRQLFCGLSGIYAKPYWPPPPPQPEV